MSLLASSLASWRQHPLSMSWAVVKPPKDASLLRLRVMLQSEGFRGEAIDF